MFCRKKCSTADIVMRVVGVGVMAVGVVTVVGFVLSKCDRLRRRTRRLACECGDAVGDATVRIAHAVDDCMSPNCEDTCCDNRQEDNTKN